MAGNRWASPAFVLAAATLLVHLLVNTGYGVYSDELYFIVCGQHLAAGYVDQPPLIPWIAGLSHALFGAAPLPLRLIPALAAAATVALTAELARTLSGGRFAQWLAAIAVALSGTLLVDGLLLTTDSLQPLTWLGCSICLVRLAQTKDERWWLGFGAIAGASLLSKYLILFFIAGLAVGVLATPLRRALLGPWLYAGAVIALALQRPASPGRPRMAGRFSSSTRTRRTARISCCRRSPSSGSRSSSPVPAPRSSGWRDCGAGR